MQPPFCGVYRPGGVGGSDEKVAHSAPLCHPPTPPSVGGASGIGSKQGGSVSPPDPPFWGVPGTPQKGPPRGPPRPGEISAGNFPGGPGPGRAGRPGGAPRGAPGGPNLGPILGPILDPFWGPYSIVFVLLGGYLGGSQKGTFLDPPGGAPRASRGGAKKCTFFWVFNNSPSRDSFGTLFLPPFFRDTRTAPPGHPPQDPPCIGVPLNHGGSAPPKGPPRWEVTSQTHHVVPP